MKNKTKKLKVDMNTLEAALAKQAPPPAPVLPAYAGQKYQYKVWTYEPDQSQGNKLENATCSACLDAFGAQGWELVNAMYSNNADFPFRFTFKRHL